MRCCTYLQCAHIIERDLFCLLYQRLRAAKVALKSAFVFLSSPGRVQFLGERQRVGTSARQP